jgi:hypothetical protein
MTTTERPHGRAKYVMERCRCDVCRQANTDYENHRARQITYGRWHPFVDAQPVREHVQALQAAGLGWRRIAILAGVNKSIVRGLLWGNKSVGDSYRKPRQRMKASTADKLLSVTASFDALADKALTDATGARRRLQALVACGWSRGKLAERLGLKRSDLTRLMNEPRVIAAKARAVRRLYDELWDQPPPSVTPGDKGAITRSLRHARTHGWRRPIEWDDDRIDDPTPTRAERASSARRMAHQGASVYAISRALGVGRPTVRKYLEAS